MSQDGWYYLHINGDLILKKSYPGDDNSSFVKRIWAVDITDRMNAWAIVLESLADGARISRVRELATKWDCDLTDFIEYLIRNSEPSDEHKQGAEIFLREIAYVDSDQFWRLLGKAVKDSTPSEIATAILADASISAAEVK